MADLTPVTREETFLNAAAEGSTDGLPTPVTREEIFLKKIAENSGSGGLAVKTLTYNGNGNTTNVITFPDTPTEILSIDGMGINGGYVHFSAFRFGSSVALGCYRDLNFGNNGTIIITASVSGNDLTLSGGADSGAVCNANGETYTIIYI